MGGAFTIVLIITSAYTAFLIFKSILPVWYRLGLSLSKRKIAILADNDNHNNLRNVLIDSKLFNPKNIENIDENSIGKVETQSLLLMHWTSHQENLDSILINKKDSAMLIIYAPMEEGRIESEELEKINKHRNVIIVNFRGRLINDVLVSMMTSFEK